MSPLPAERINETLARVRQHAGTGWITNHFGNLHSPGPYPSVQTEGCLLFLDRDRGFDHLLFGSAGPGPLEEALRALPAGVHVLDWLFKVQVPGLEEVLLRQGFKPLAHYQRIAATMPKVPAVKGPTDFAGEHEMEALHDRFPSLFDARLDHLPSLAGLRAMAADRRIVVNRDAAGAIAGFFIFQIHGVRAHLNYWWNPKESGPNAGLELLIRAYHEMQTRGARLVHAWVNVLNRRVIQVHRHFGLVPDGLCNTIYHREHQT